jgi:hypothetical protein
MTRGAVILAMVSALFLGVSLGFMSGVVFSRHLLLERHLSWHEWRGGRHSAPGLPSSRALLPHLAEMLDLTPAQGDSVRGEIERTRADFAQVRDSLHARIERHLTPAQRERWRAQMRERRLGELRGRDPRTLRAEPGREGESWK